MHLEKPSLSRHLQDPSNKGYKVLQRIFFTSTSNGQAAGAAFVERLAERKEDLDGVSGPEVAKAQMAAFRDWERVTGERFADLRGIAHPTLVVNGVRDEMIPVVNSYRLSEKPAQRRTTDISGCRPWVVVPVSRIVRASRGGVPFRRRGILRLLREHAVMPMIDIYAGRGYVRGRQETCR